MAIDNTQHTHTPMLVDLFRFLRDIYEIGEYIRTTQLEQCRLQDTHTQHDETGPIHTQNSVEIRRFL